LAFFHPVSVPSILRVLPSGSSLYTGSNEKGKKSTGIGIKGAG